jgi:MFS transporter, NNP family, nitrate/nitrite transporter
MNEVSSRFNLLSFTGKMRVLHLTWIAFFISFMVWFSHAGLMVFIRETLGLSAVEVNTLIALNLALTIPSRVIVGMLVDKYGPRLLFAGILILGGLVTFTFALAENYQQIAISRFLLGFVGSGFVVGIRIIGEWFPAKEAGLAQGIYGGWGNFGSAAGIILLPFLAQSVFGGDDGWRIAVGIAGSISIVYGVFYYFAVQNNPKGSTYFKPKKMGGLEVTSKGDLALYLLMNIPLYLALGLLCWKLSPAKLNFIGNTLSYSIYALLIVVYFFQSWKIISINKAIFTAPVPELHRYSFSQVAVLDLAYMVTFGTELILVQMLALFYVDYFGADKLLATILAGLFPFINLVARPGGGWISDKIGRKRTLVIVFSGITASFILLSQVEATWSLGVVVMITLVAGVFAKGGSGAVFAMVPLIQRRYTGQIAGMAGAYGNVGGVAFSLVLLETGSPHALFMSVGIVAAAVLVSTLLFLKEPKGHMTEILEDGSVQLISVEK